MDLQNQYDELYNIVTTLDCLADETENKYYKDMINSLKYEAEDEMKEVEEALYKQELTEQKELEYEYNKERI